ncbi:hypermethylated in cancer 2 protein-like [Acipenser ruthenus]|uniref:hypermethylated in cancer 2 protein-like n=1 Tax=Acipenser ruthenus TaxID=7906 RepID=UPI002741052A|nr:hypermethylated in cancer 2 protein-like [Acipenser ruthenus]XP_058865030.1 hypermethylated in cancer 2 protein-like [Acipenser ruthenus]
MDPDNSSCSSGVTGPSPSRRLVDLQFPNYSAVLLEHLNQHREEGKFCDLAVHVRGQVFRAHKAVLAASSSYFHDKLMLRDSDVIVLPSVIEPRAFAGLLGLIYTGRLRVTVQDMPSYLLVASGLQLWHVVDRCKEILKREEEQKHFSKKRSYRNCRSTSQSPSSSQVLVGCREDTGGRDCAARVHTQEGLAVRREWEGGRQGGPEGQEGEDGPCLRPNSNSKTKEELYYSTEREDHYYYSNSNNTTGKDEEYEVDEDMEGAETEDDDVIKVHVQSEEEEEEEEEGGVLNAERRRDGEGEICSGSIDENGRMVMIEVDRERGRERKRGPLEREAAASYSYKLVHKQDSQPSPEHRQQALSNSSNWFSTAAGAASVHDSSGGAFSSMGELRLGRLGTLGAGSGLVHVKEESWEEGEREGKVQTNGSGQGMNFIDSISGSVTCKSNDEVSQAGFTVYSEGAGGRSSDCFLLSALHSKEPGPVSLLAAGSVVVDSASFPDGTRVIADPTGYPANAVTQQPMDIHGNEIVTHASLGQAVHAPVKILSVEPDGKRFGCLCGKRFAVKPKRDRHIMLTLSVRPFDCSVCEKKFKLKHHLNEHMKTHTGFLYKCERCGRKFRMRSCYLKHLQQEEEQLQQQSASASSVL